jgi:FAD:protein FMN transferase
VGGGRVRILAGEHDRVPDLNVPFALALAAMGTRFELVMADDAARESERRALGEAALEVVAELDRRLSRFRRDGIPQALARAGVAGLRVTSDELALFELCRRAHRASGGAFDPAITAALARLGLRDEPAGVAIPFAAVRIDRRERRVAAPPGLAPLDFGAVAKGFALDLAARLLGDGGARVALLQGGTSSVVALGAPPGRDAWCVALRDPSLPSDRPSRPLARVALRDAALSVSAPHGRVRLAGGRPVGHVVDPRDGAPVERVRLVAVVARHGATAEVASTSLLIACERALREARPLAGCASLLPPRAAALVAFETAGGLAVEFLGPSAGLFTEVAPRREPAESPS